MSDITISLPVSPARDTFLAGAPHGKPFPERIPVLDGLRGIAILLVMIYHFWRFGSYHSWMDGPTATLSFWEQAYSNAAGMGWAGVDLFFILSGFLITGILYDSRDSKHYFRVFYARRTVRIFPLYYGFLVFYFWIIPFVMAHFAHVELAEIHDSAHAKFFAWTYLVNWYEGFNGFDVLTTPLQHFWSLAVEEQFYFIWPFLVLKLARRRLMSVCSWIVLSALVLRAAFFLMHLPYVSYMGTFCRADSLAIGAIVALAARNPDDWKSIVKWARLLAFPALCGVITLRILNPVCIAGPGNSPVFFMITLEISLIAIFFGACLVLVLSLRQEGRVHRLMGASFLRFFGKYSYCLYICHLPIVAMLAKGGLNSEQLTDWLDNELLAVLLVNFIAFAVSICVALASWHLYEKQWLKLKDLAPLQR
jgi:peptidoglycan/LPS O-acetylase OafA/YrhL